MNPSTTLSLQPAPERAFSSRDGIRNLLLLSICFSCFLVIARIIHTGSVIFICMIWNLLLGCIPWVISNCMQPLQAQSRNGSLSPMAPKPAGRLLSGLYIGIWLLFIPNSFYMLTDLFHLADHSNHPRVPQWYDLALLLSFAWNGLLIGVLSVRRMQKILGVPEKYELLFLCPLMLLNALGVYVGRYLRYNSWDLVKDPLQLVRDITGIIINPLPHAWGMILCFSLLMTLMYLMLKKISRAMA